MGGYLTTIGGGLFPPDDLAIETDHTPNPANARGGKSDAKARAAALTHDDLTRLGARWLRGNNYTAFRETGAGPNGNEIADVIGWRGEGTSILIECKRSRADFRRDMQKDCRIIDDLGYGVYRYYLCPAGLLQASDMPPKWGLLWAYDNRITRRKPAEMFDPGRAAIAEKKLLTSLIRRLDGDIRDICTQEGLTPPSRHL